MLSNRHFGRITRDGNQGGRSSVAVAGWFGLIGAVVFVVMIFILVVPEVRANRSYVETSCVVLERRVGVSHGKGETYRPEVRIKYEVGGQVFDVWTYDAVWVYSSGRSGKQAAIDRFVPGQRYPCWYDPARPSRAVVARGYSWLGYLAMLIPLLFVAVGVRGVRRGWGTFGKSPERRAAAQAAGRRESDLEDEFDAPAAFTSVKEAYPNVPIAPVHVRPGAVLKYQLPAGTHPGSVAAALLVASLFWNGIISVFVARVVSQHRQGRPDWFLDAFLVPVVVVGLGLIAAFFWKLLAALTVKMAVVEVSDSPQRPGGTYEGYLMQPGRLTLNSVAVRLVCRESATSNRGEDNVSARKVVHETVIHAEEGVSCDDGMPYEARFRYEVPAGAMHSFKAPHNAVEWLLNVRGDVTGRPDFDREYPLIVVPAAKTATGTASAHPITIESDHVQIMLDRAPDIFPPDETLSGHYRVLPRPDGAVCTAIECSVGWWTAGKGDPDSGVVFFDRVEASELEPTLADRDRRFSVVLPASPLSYDGVVMQIRWQVRVRAFFKGHGDEPAALDFRLGAVAPAAAGAL